MSDILFTRYQTIKTFRLFLFDFAVSLHRSKTSTSLKALVLNYAEVILDILNHDPRYESLIRNRHKLYFFGETGMRVSVVRARVFRLGIGVIVMCGIYAIWSVLTFETRFAERLSRMGGFGYSFYYRNYHRDLGWMTERLPLRLPEKCDCLANIHTVYQTSTADPSNPNFHSKNVMSDLVSTMAKLRCLQSLTLSGTQIDDADLGKLVGSKPLVSLRIGGTPITDAGAKHLEKMTWLECLDISTTKLTDDGLQRLKGLKSLNYLNLSHTLITDAGLQSIMGLPSLGEINLTNTRTTPEGREALRKTLPVFCKVVCDQ